jgi:TolB-like protein
MHGLNELSAYGAHPKDFDSEQVKPVLVNLDIIIKWYLKYKETGTDIKAKPSEEIRTELRSTEDVKKSIHIPKIRLIGLLSGLILLVLIVVAVLFFINIIGGDKQTKELDKSIAVLPFKLLSDEPDKQYLADGMMDAITLHLSKIKDLRVMSRTSVEQYRETTKTTGTIGKELDVAYILEGSFQKVGDNARLIVQLIKTGKEGHVWANDYDRNWNNVFSVQSEVAQTIAKELYASITPAEKGLIEKVPTANLAAYDLYLKANNYNNDYQKTRNISSYQNAVTFYKAAIAIDSAFAKAYTGLASAYYDRYQWETYFKENYLDSIKVLANHALSFDDQLDEAYYLKGRYYQENEQIEDALNNYNKALKINPSYYSAFYQKGTILILVKQDYVKGLESIEKSLNLIYGNELPIALYSVGYVWMMVGFSEKAKNYYQEAVKLDGDSASYYRFLASLEFTNDNLNNAVLFLEKAVKIDSTIDEPFEFYSFAGQDQKAYLAAKKRVEQIEKTGELALAYSHRIGYAFSQVGKMKEATFWFNQQIKYGEDDIKLGRKQVQEHHVYYDLAATYAFIGDKVKAYQYLDEYNKDNFYSSIMLSYAKHDVLLDKIRNEERFQKILQNMEAKYQAEHDRVKKWLEEQGML